MKFHVIAFGDRTVGDGTHYAYVDIPYIYISESAEDAKDFESFIREELRVCFSNIFDSKARVLSDTEYQQEIIGG